MSIQFNAYEVFGIAVAIEQNGYDFYSEMSEKTFDDGTRRILAKLAEMEKDHKTIFSELRKDLCGPEMATEWFDPNGDAAAYLRLFAGDHVFSLNIKESKKPDEDASIEDVLLFAIEREKESILFYNGVQRLIREEPGADKIDYVISEEMDHIAILCKILDENENGGIKA